MVQALLEMVCTGSSDTELQATAAIALGNLTRYSANRCSYLPAFKADWRPGPRSSLWAMVCEP